MIESPSVVFSTNLDAITRLQYKIIYQQPGRAISHDENDAGSAIGNPYNLHAIAFFALLGRSRQVI